MVTMIGCPACSKTVSSDASYCPHCGHRVRDETRPAAAPSSAQSSNAGRWIIIATIFIGGPLLVIGAMMASPTSRNDDPPRTQNLKVSAGRGTLGLTITNREAVAVERCDVTLLDQGNDRWVAPLPGALRPMETANLLWSEFTAGGQPMPSYIGQNRDNFIVSCIVTGATRERRSAGLSF